MKNANNPSLNKPSKHLTEKEFDWLMVTIGYIALLSLIGWIFYLTRNPLTFLLLIFGMHPAKENR